MVKRPGLREQQPLTVVPEPSQSPTAKDPLMRFSQDHLVYLAAPYTNSDPKVARQREDAINAVASALIRDGAAVFSPINYGHAIQHLQDDLSQDEWYRFDLHFLRRCDSLTVVMLPGWKESIGVNIEIHQARELGIPVNYMDPESAPRRTNNAMSAPRSLSSPEGHLADWILEHVHATGDPQDSTTGYDILQALSQEHPPDEMGNTLGHSRHELITRVREVVPGFPTRGEKIWSTQAKAKTMLYRGVRLT